MLEKFTEAVNHLYARSWEKLFYIGPVKLLTRKWAKLFGISVEREVELFFGSPMTIILPEVTSEQLYSYGFFDATVTWLAMHAVRSGDLVIDVGAHFGYFSLLFSHLVGDSGRVISFEPTPSTFSVLKKNTAGMKNVTTVNAAAGRQNGRLAISDYGLTYSAWNTLSTSSRMPGVLGQPKARVEVDVIRLDDWCNREVFHPTVIKIDAENFEEEVIAGLSETLARFHPRVLMETGSEQAIQAGLALLDLDYQVLVSTQPGVLTLQKDGIEEALIRNKDVLFVPATQVTEFMGRARAS